MKRIHFSIQMNASPQKVWNVLWGKESYKKWTNVFSESSDVITDWKEGSKVLFTDGKGDGMVSRIDEIRPLEFMSFRHLGMLKNGIEDTTSEEVTEWSGATENYTLAEIKGETKLLVEMDITDDFVDYFTKTWPKALEELKKITEKL